MNIRDKIKDIIVEGVPLNTTCNSCERDVERETLIDTEAQADWDELTDNILKEVGNHIENL